MNSSMSLEQAEFLFHKLHIAVVCSNGAPVNADVKTAREDGNVYKPYKRAVKKTYSDGGLNQVS